MTSINDPLIKGEESNNNNNNNNNNNKTERYGGRARLPHRMRIKTPCNARAPRSYASCARAKKNKETPLASFLVSSEIF